VTASDCSIENFVSVKYDGSCPTSEHLFRQPRGGGVRDRVVHVHQVELLAFGDFVLFDREG